MDDKKSSLREENLVPPPLRRFIPVTGGIIIGLALFGYVAGIRELPPVVSASPAPSSANGGYPFAVTYRELPTARLSPEPLREQTLRDLKFERPDIFAPVTKTEAMKQQAIADRSRNRAYEGAPPTVPHPIDQRSSTACMACHADGIKVGERVASRMSHAMFSNCTQCHVSQQPDIAAADPVEVISNFVGASRSGPGSRASAGAPPTIPHHTWMRENCSTCHGTLTRGGLRSTHPWLTNCQQCHAPTAARDPSMFVGEWP